MSVECCGRKESAEKWNYGKEYKMARITIGTEVIEFHDNNTATITKTSMFSGKDTTVIIPVTLKQWCAWNSGQLIQDAMPQLEPWQREFLMTGVTSEEWNEEFKEDEK
jgi:hypothetical protein